MKLISLNTWGGQILDPLLEFIETNSQDTDIFCFQEVPSVDGTSPYSEFPHDLLTKIQHVLGGFEMVFYTLLEETKFRYGLAIFLKKDIKLISSGGILIERRQGINMDKGIQFIQITINGKNVWIGNIHGVAMPSNKLDSPERIEQSKKVINLFKDQKDKILVGDFNLSPETESIKVIESEGMKNLIKEFDIRDTRGAVNHARYPGKIQYFSDYAFVSESIKVERFEVPQVKISDHLPLVLDFK